MEIKFNMKIAHINIRSIFTGFNDFSRIVLEEDFDILAVSETWLSDDVDVNLVAIPGYHFLHKPRATRGGGIGVYYKQSYSSQEINFEFDINDCLEYLFLKFTIRSKNIIIGVFYRPPNTNINNFITDFDNILSSICITDAEIVCLGDLNVNFFNLNNPVMNCFESYGFSQLLNEPTRVSHTSITLIDPVFINNNELVKAVGTLSFDGISDHRLVFVELKLERAKIPPRIINYRCFRNFDLDVFLADLYSLPWYDVIIENDIDEKIRIFNNLLSLLFDRHAPIKERKVSKPKAPWLTDNLKLLMKQRDKALQKYKRTHSEADWVYYKELRNLAVTMTRNEKAAYLNAICLENNSSKMWKTLRNLNVSSNLDNKIPSNISDPDEINRYFSAFLQNVTNDTRDKINFYNNNLWSTNISFSFSMTSVSEVNDILHGIKTNASGVDGINANMLRYCSPFIDQFIVNIINSSIEKKYFPFLWKVAIGQPLPKKKVCKEYGDLRIISILPVLSKIFERIMYNQTLKYFNENKLIPDNQNGFRKGFSTATALASVTNDIIEAYDRGLISVLLLLDFSKAFDTIDHTLLLAKLKYYGFDDGSHALINSYLRGRSQKVCVNGNVSSGLDILSGVPQGSILGPLLFIIYTADIIKSVTHCKVQAYADDTQLYRHFHIDDLIVNSEYINTELFNIMQISKEHALKLNSSKTILLCFSTKNDRKILQKNFNIFIDKIPIPFSDSVRNLGVHLDTDIRYTEHIKNLIKKAYASLKLIYCNRHILNQSLKKQLCESLVLSHFSYCDFLYGPCIKQSDKIRIQKVQNSCCRLIYGLRKFDHISQKMVQTNWLNMSNRRLLHLANFTHKLLNSDYSSLCLKNKLVPVFSIHSRNTRFKNRFILPRHRTAMFSRSFIFNAVSLLNSLPEEFKSLNINKFKYKYKDYLLSEQNK